MNLVETILKVDKTSDIVTIRRCLNKANIIIFFDGIYLVCDDTYIYYFGAEEKSRTPSKLGRFVKQFKHLASGKLLYSKDVTPFKHYIECINKEKGLYKWK